MEKDLDKKLYNDYLNGEKQAFELLYNKYKSKIEYFIFNIVKDYQRAEDLTQETFIYVMQNRMKSDCSFKYFIYLVAKSKAYNYINIETRRNEITEQYLTNNDEQVEKDVLEIITKEETKNELLEAIELLDEKYKNAVYLVNIEGLSYKETSNILGETLQNTKNLVHRGKKQLRKILLKKGFDEMNKISKVCVILICSIVLLTGIAYAGVVIYNEFIKKQDEVQSRGLFDLGDGITTYEIDLMQNDMTWNDKSRLYHRLISNSADYEKYKSRVSELPDVTEINFDESFVVIIANENIRQMHEKDLTIYNVTADDNTTHIIMKQKENPNYDNENNIWYAVIDKSLLRENADVTIEYKEIDTNGFTKVEELPKDYSVEQAIKDGCVVTENHKIISNNVDLLNKFVEDTEIGKKSFIRTYITGGDNQKEYTYIQDVEYVNGIYYVSNYDLKTSKIMSFHSYSNKLKKIQNSNGTEYVWFSEDGLNGTTFIIIQ